MLSPEAFREAYSDDELADELPDSPIGSLRDIQYLYGKLYTLATTGGGKYAPYLTPDAAGDLVDTDDSLIVVRVDLTGDPPKLADDERGPVLVTRYTNELVEKIGHCYYQNRGAGIDHSITHKSGKNKNAERLGKYATDRFTRWPTENAVANLVETHEDGWIIKNIADIAEDEETLEKIKEEVERQISDGQTSILTVQVKTDDNGEYRWPGDVDVLMDAMRAQRLSKLVTKNKAKNSSGVANDLIFGETTRTVGTAQDPMNYFLGKQRETFPGLDIENAWRSHPISEDSAITVMNAEAFIEACTYRTYGTKIYCLPYVFGRLTPNKVCKLYDLLYRAVEDDETTPIEDAYIQERDAELTDRIFRFYVSAVMPHQTSRYDVFGETMNGRLHYPKELAFTHNRLVKDASAFKRKPNAEWTAPLPTNEKWGLLETNDDQLHAVSTGWYFIQTFAERDDDEADADDPRIEALVNVLSGEPIAVDLLLEEYVTRIIDEQADDDEHEGFPSFVVASQFAQLCALADEDLSLLKPNDPSKEPITHEPTYDRYTITPLEQISIMTDGGHPAAPKLESFIRETPALSPKYDDEEGSVTPQRRGAFLLGALVGDIGSYQEYYEERSTTLVDQYPVKSITRSRIKKVTQETVAKTLTYTRQEKKERGSYPGTKADHIVDRLRNTILNPDPDEWEIDTDDLRFYYALGVTYGMNDHPWSQGNSDADDSEEEH